MSCFRGLMEEYRYLSIDRFDGANLSSSAFFLSHCHADHMVGLDGDCFKRRLFSRNDIYIYCSEVTKLLLEADDRYKDLSNQICGLQIEDPKIIETVSDDGKTHLVSVTLLPAAHCPGSVMFLFEGNEGSVLYTGDFRLPEDSAHRMKNLHTSIGSKKSLKSIYVDTTFCAKNSFFIPSREDCLKGLKYIIRDWLRKGNSNVIRLNVSAKYGYEFLFRALHEEFGTKIYCKRKSAYVCLPETHDVLTLDAVNAKIFVCFKQETLHKHWKNVGGEVKFPGKRDILTITLSTMYFTYAALPHEIYQKVGENHYRFCFSFHSSYSEVCDFVKYLHPQNVYANVKPMGCSSLEEVAQNLCIECGFEEKLQGESSIEEEFLKPNANLPAAMATFRSEAKPRKRVLSFSGASGDDTQEHFESFLAKTRRKRSVLGGVDKVQASVQNCNELVGAESDFLISSSPGNKPPLQSELDALHAKIAQNFGLPPPT